MNIFIFTDLEGIPGVSDISDIESGTEKYEKSCRKLEECINITVNACKKYGADEIWYIDGHAGGGNVKDENITPYAKRISIAEWQELLKAGKIDVQIELGSHARAGTLGGFLDHTVSSRSWFCHKVNGIEQSELSLHSLVCGAYGVPTVLCIGDETVCRQAKEYIPNIITAPVKKASDRNTCICYENSDEIIEDAVCEALREYPDILPYTVEGELTVSLTFTRSDYCERAIDRINGNVTRVDARTLEKKLDKITCYADIKFGNA